jgi:hypothetical protein
VIKDTEYGLAFQEILRIKYGDNSQQSYSDWICENTLLKAKKYSFRDHEYQFSPVDDPARILVMEKCAQMGFTECFFRWMLAFLVKHQGSQGIFTQPTDRDMSTFAKSRADVIMEECPVVKRLGTGGVDSVQLKRIGSSFLNLRGTFGSRAAISVPSDANNYDEVNFSNPRVLNQYKSRLQHSAYKYERYISTPTIPNYGVSELYNRSDRKRLFIKCNHCGEQQTLDWPTSIFFKEHSTGKVIPHNDEFIELYIEKEYEYQPFIGCKKCHRELDRSWQYREWVAEFPERNRDPDSGISGYHINQLDATYISALEIVRASDKRLDGYKKIEDFYNFVLALPYEGGDSVKITEASKQVATIPLAMPDSGSGCYLGVDLGSTCHIVIIKDIYLPTKIGPTPVVIAAYRVSKDVLEERLPEFIKKYGCLFVVSDAQPYTITVEKIAKMHLNRMSVCFFGGKKSYSLTSDYINVTANRTNALDEVTDSIPVGNTLVASGIPDYDILWQHMKNLVKVKAEDDDGSEYYEYVKVGEDHYGYALCYALLARKIFLETRPNAKECSAPVNITGTAVSI